MSSDHVVCICCCSAVHGTVDWLCKQSLKSRCFPLCLLIQETVAWCRRASLLERFLHEGLCSSVSQLCGLSAAKWSCEVCVFAWINIIMIISGQMITLNVPSSFLILTSQRDNPMFPLGFFCDTFEIDSKPFDLFYFFFNPLDTTRDVNNNKCIR